MTVPRSTDDRPHAGLPPVPTPPSADKAPPLAPSAEPSREQSPWWTAPSGKPFNIPDFAHECAALLMRLLVPAAQQPAVLRVGAGRRRSARRRHA
ncbi:MAG: hypothetical protein ACOY5F_05300 [Pseudomonadota bacterium]